MARQQPLWALLAFSCVSLTHMYTHIHSYAGRDKAEGPFIIWSSVNKEALTAGRNEENNWHHKDEMFFLKMGRAQRISISSTLEKNKEVVQ